MESFVSFLPPPSFMVCLHACSSVHCMHVFICECLYMSTYLIDVLIAWICIVCNCVYIHVCTCMNIRLYTYMVCVYFCVLVYVLYNFVYMWTLV